ncbi:hypothetical protein [Paraburkholderia caffeinilytica]|uniref:hypothetical protein n=1 Tax=Paraburkholderia caffeinilytica TaxID=1761016 RepID=UPI0038B910EA
MRNPAMRDMREPVFSVGPAPRERSVPRVSSLPANAKSWPSAKSGPDRSAWRAMQKPPLSVLASNSSEHAHVLAVAILGYN